MIGRCVLHLRAASWRRPLRHRRACRIHRRHGLPVEDQFVEQIRMALQSARGVRGRGSGTCTGIDLAAGPVVVDGRAGGTRADAPAGEWPAGGEGLGADACRRLRERLLAEARERVVLRPAPPWRVAGDGMVGPGG